MNDIFRETREHVTAEDAARHYGLTFNSRGWAVCPFHQDRNPSMSFRAGRFHCWACNASGDSIDFTSKLLNLSLLDAVKRLNADFDLGLNLERRKPPPEERREVQRRKEIARVHRQFEEWQSNMIRQLSVCLRLTNTTLKNIESLDQLTNVQALAIREQARFEWLADTLTGGTMAEQMAIFRERGQIGQLCNRILRNTPTKSGAA